MGLGAAMLGALRVAAAAEAQMDAVAVDPAAQFGALESVMGTTLSPDGRHIAVIRPVSNTTNGLVMIDVAEGRVAPIAGADPSLRVVTRKTSCGVDRGLLGPTQSRPSRLA